MDYYSSEYFINWMRLSRTASIGPITFSALMEKYNDPEKILYDLSEKIKMSQGSKIIIPTKKSIIDEINYATDHEISIIPSYCNLYPKTLLSIKDNPSIIYTKGNITLLKNKSIAIVGSRNASLNSINIAGSISKNLSLNNFSIVSGLALGIDSIAHERSMCSDFSTIAVLASGLDIIYPEQNIGLAQEILDNNGLLISEQAPKTIPKAFLFPSRNRIISGLSTATVIIEASSKSGSLITAEFALKQNRKLFAVPGSPTDHRSYGTNNLIKTGKATLIESHTDIINFLNNNESNQLDLSLNDSSYNSFQYKNNKNKEKDNIIEIKKKIIELLSSSYPTKQNSLLQYLPNSTNNILIAILELEIEGILSRNENDELILI